MDNISVTGEFGRKPALAFEGTPSDELVVEVLRAGDGQEVEAGDTITCHYLGAVFGSATDFDNSFDRGGAAERSEERRVGKECRSRWSPYH